MHYVVYLDEFGHIGPFVGRDHPSYNDSPVFGLAGIMLPAEEVREFAIYFYQLKCRLLAWELQSSEKNPGRLPAYQWEKKGSSLYTPSNIQKYPELRRATFRLLNRIERIGGRVFFTGEHKVAPPREHDSTRIYRRQLLQSIRKLDRFCASSDATFMLILDEQRNNGRGRGQRDEWRERNVEACTLTMFEDLGEKCRRLIEPPVQGESHLFQTLQCADWLCGLLGRLTAFVTAPGEFGDWGVFERYFADRLQRVMLPSSGVERWSVAAAAALQAGALMPEVDGILN